MRGTPGDKQRIQHILKAIKEIENYIGELSAESFFNSSLIKSGSVFQLEIIGEAANKISKGTKEKYSHIPWNEIVAVRNIIAHFYWGIDYVQVWEIIKKELPVLRENMKLILQEL